MVLGSIYSANASPFSYFILAAALITIVYFIDYWLEAHKCGSVPPKAANAIGFIGMVLLLFYFGVLSPLIPVKEFLLGLGVALLLPQAYLALRGR
jgi:hypothetical protein